MRRLLRIVGKIAKWTGVALALVLALSVTGFLVGTRTDWGHRKLLALLLPRVNNGLAGRLAIGRLDGNVTNEVVLRDVVVYDVEGKEAVRAARVGMKWQPLALIHKTLEITSLVLDGVEVTARPLADGRQNLAALTRPSEPKQDTGPSSLVIALDRAEVTGHGVMKDTTGTRVEGRLHVVAGVRIAKGLVELATLKGLTADTALPARAHLEAHGQARQRSDGAFAIDGVDLHATSSGEELARLAPSTAIVGPLDLVAHVDGGTADVLRARLRLTPAHGYIEADAQGALRTAGVKWQGSVHLADLDPALWRGAPSGSVTGQIDGQGTGKEGEVVVKELHALVDGARATLTGRGDLAGNGVAELHVDAPDLAQSKELAKQVKGRSRGSLTAVVKAERKAGVVNAEARVSGARLAVAGARARVVEVLAHVQNLRSPSDIGAADARVTVVDGATKGARAGRVKVDATLAGFRGAADIARAHAKVSVAKVAAGSASAKRFDLDANVRDFHGFENLHHTIVDARGYGSGIRAGTNAAHEVKLDVHTRGLDGSGTLHALGVDAAGRRFDQVGLVASGNGRDGAVGIELMAPDLRMSLGAHSSFRFADGKLAALNGELQRFELLARKSRYGLEAPAPFVVDQGGITIGQVHIDGPEAHVLFAGAYRRTGAIEAHFEARKVRVDQMVALVAPARAQSMAPITLNAVVDAGGTTAQPEVTGAISGEMGGNPTQVEQAGIGTWPSPLKSFLARRGRIQGSVALHYARGRAVVAIHAGDQRKASVDLSGTVPLPLQQSGPIALQGTILNIPPEMFAAFKPDLADWGGWFDAELHGTGTVENPQLAVTLRAKDIRGASFDKLNAQLDVRMLDDQVQVTLDSSLRGSKLAQAVVKAKLTTDLDDIVLGKRHGDLGGTIDGDLWVKGFDLDRLRGIAYDADVRGQLRAHAKVTGALLDPRATADLELAGLSVDQLVIPRAAVHGGWDGTAATAQVVVDEKGGGSLRAYATLPRDATQPINAHAAANKLDIRFASMFAGGAVGDVKGLLDLKVDASGPRATPTVNGQLHLRDASFVLSADARRYKDVAIDLAVTPERVTLSKLHASSGDGRVDAHAELVIDHLRPQALDGEIDASKFAFVVGDSGTATLDGRIRIDGNAVAQGFAGTVAVNDGTVRLPKFSSGKKLQKVGALEDVVYVDRKAQKEDASKGGGGVSLKMKVKIPGPFQLRGPEIDTDLSGDLTVAIDGGSVGVGGVIETGQGWIDVLGHRFDIDQVRVSFDGSDQIDPTLDIKVARQVADARLVVQITGTAAEPKLDLLSDPPIYNQTQILAMLLSDDPNAPPSSASLDQKVVGAISGVIVGKIKDQIAPGLPIDVLKVDVPTEGMAATRVEVGKFITPKLYLSYVHQFGNITGFQPRNQNEAGVEWRFARRYVLDTTFGDAGVGNADVSYTIRY